MPESTLVTFKPGAARKQKLSICIFARGGTGKTSLLGTMPGKGLVVDIPQMEGGTYVLEDHADRIDVTTIEKWDEIDKIFWHLKDPKNHNYDWVAIDTVTAMTRLALRKTIGERALNVNPHKITQPEWGVVGQMVAELVLKFKLLPVHVIWLAQEKMFGYDNQPNVLGPDTSPAARATLLPPLMMCGRLWVEHTMEGAAERHMRVHKHADYDTKIRVKPGVDMPGIIKNPDLGQIIRYALTGNGERPEEVSESGFLFAMTTETDLIVESSTEPELSIG